MAFALCLTSLAPTALPSAALSGPSVSQRLRRADAALTRALGAADARRDAAVVAGLHSAAHQTNLAMKSALRLAAQDRHDGGDVLAAVTHQQQANVAAAMALLDGASAAVAGAVDTVLAATESGRRRLAAHLERTGDREPAPAN